MKKANVPLKKNNGTDNVKKQKNLLCFFKKDENIKKRKLMEDSSIELAEQQSNKRHREGEKHAFTEENDSKIISTEWKDVFVVQYKQNNESDHIATSEQNKENEKIDLSDVEILDEFNDCFEEWNDTNTDINFSTFQRCIISDIKRESNSILLTVKKEKSGTHSTQIVCHGFWIHSMLKIDDIIMVKARKEEDQWIVDNNSGFLVVHPDVLISGTTVVGALFCRRKAVLAEKFKQIEELPYFKGDQLPVVIGSLAHQLFQSALKKDIQDESDVKGLMDNILKSRDTSNLLYISEITFDECKQQLLTYVPKIFDFIQHYVKDKKQQQISNMRNNFKGSITNVCDIEENIWLPELGVKGKVDVSVEVKINSSRKIMPLEIKTGKPSFSLEHKGQIILYIMMMMLTGQETDTGLLLYLRENIMQEISSGHPEKRDLILLRNTLAHYFGQKSSQQSTSSISETDLQMLELPEPINHPACSKCTYNALCCAFLNKDTNMRLSDSHPLTKLGKKILDKFKPTHIDYVLQWISLLQIEESAQSSENIMRYLWTLSPEKREGMRICVCNLKVIGNVVERNSKYKHTFVRTNVKVQFSNTKIPYLEFADNEYVLISTNTRINISAGFVVKRQEDSITVLLDRDITKCNINGFFHIDKYSSSRLYSFNLANVGGLLGDNEICERLRDIVIDRKPATFRKGVPYSIIQKSAKILQNLNENQQRAVLQAMSTNDYILIKGMPGTGKTQTLVALIELLHKTGQSVLITAHTNSAVDNILLKLLNQGIDFIRLGSSIHPLLKQKSEAHATLKCNSPESLEAVYSSKSIIGVTCYGAHHALLGKRTFDFCLVDECTQALQSAVLRPLYSVKKFVLVGDPDQLPPIVKSKLARKLGAEESLFARLDSENNTVNLAKQYRMNSRIMYVANKLTYNNMLEAGHASVEHATLIAPSKQVLMKEPAWLQKVLSSEIDDSVIVLNTGRTCKMKANFEINTKFPESDQVNANIYEAVIVAKLAQILIKLDVKLEDIGVIAPYRAHVNILKKVVLNGVEINTVDQYQGRDKEVIIYSCAKSLTKSEIKEDLEVLGDHRRLTVAVTRAKRKLIIIADTRALSQYSAFKKLFSIVEDKNILNLKNGCDDFSWTSLVSCL